MVGKAATPSLAEPERKKAVSVGAGDVGAQPSEGEMKEETPAVHGAQAPLP